MGVFVGDSFQKPPLVFRLLRCLGCMSLLIDVCTTAIHVVFVTCCVLDSGGLVTFSSRLGVGV